MMMGDDDNDNDDDDDDADDDDDDDADDDDDDVAAPPAHRPCCCCCCCCRGVRGLLGGRDGREWVELATHQPTGSPEGSPGTGVERSRAPLRSAIPSCTPTTC